ncbi:MAG: hypothetical protein H6831_13950 [Planctomycetes bacterium]|nr:hypothetical protein [Planctomycetota bacterium]MCB9905503.1 hypothetical protein [Planctomycetota bacterium]
MTDPTPKVTTTARGMWLALGFVLSLFLVPYFIGFTLPDDYEGAVQVDVAFEPQRVWDELMRHDAHPLAGGSVQAVVELPATETGPAWEEHLERAQLVVETRVMQPPTRLERVALDRSNGVESTWQYELTPIDGGTRLLARQHLRITEPSFATPYFRVFTHYLDFAQQAPRDQVESVVRALGVDDFEVVPVN